MGHTWILSLCCLVGQLALGATQTGSYLILVPKNFRPGLPLDVNVNIFKGTSDVTIQAQLLDSAGIEVTSGQQVFQKDKPEKVTLQVPLMIGSFLSPFNLTVTATGGLDFTNSTYITLDTHNVQILIQTDKSIYKASQTVNFRAMAVTPDLKTVSDPMDIEIFDAKGNKVFQSLEQTGDNGVTKDDFELSDQPPMGTWRIKVTMRGETVEKTFIVDDYVLPKFEVTVTLDPYILSTSDSVNGVVEAKYTYGQGVKGNVLLRVKAKHRWGRVLIYVTEMMIDGKVDVSIPLKYLKEYPSDSLTDNEITISANVTDILTGEERSGEGMTSVHDTTVKMTVLTSSSMSVYKPGMTYTVFFQLTQPDDRPLLAADQNYPVQIEAKYSGSWSDPFTPIKNLSIPDDGIIKADVDIPANVQFVRIKAIYLGKKQLMEEYSTWTKFRSNSNSSIQALVLTQSVKVGENVAFEVRVTEGDQTVFYQITSRGQMWASGSLVVPTSGTAQFEVITTRMMSPTATIVMYYVRPDGELLADSMEFNVEGVFENQVTLNFVKDKMEAKDNATLEVNTRAGSYVGVLVVDHSVKLLKEGNDLNQDEIVSGLRTFSSPDRRYGGYNRFWFYPMYLGGTSTGEVLSNAGFGMLSDTNIPPYFKFGFEMPQMMPVGAMENDGVMFKSTSLGSNNAVSLQEVNSVRTFFPETWIWKDTIAGANGKAIFRDTVPDTITSWIATGFSVNSEQGLGISANEAKLQAFQPFFLSLNLPSSIVQGEWFSLQAIVFNYVEQDEEVYVTLQESTEFEVAYGIDNNGQMMMKSTKVTEILQVPQKSGKSVRFWIKPVRIGNIKLEVHAQTSSRADAVSRVLRVKPEGITHFFNKPYFVDLSASGLNTQFTIPFPVSGIVDGSERIEVTAMGDLMGPALQGLQGLVRMPYGCGEQNMVNFAPLVFVTKYLRVTNQLTAALESKSKKFISKGYQRELTYQRRDGSFSAFGDRDPAGSTWLTAFVLKCFNRARSMTYIEDKLVIKAIRFILNNQTVDGRYLESGKVFHTGMQGGSASNVTLTAYVLIAMLENKDVQYGSKDMSGKNDIIRSIESATAFLEKQVALTSDPYALSIISYTLALARNPNAQTALDKLNAMAVTEDGMKYWNVDTTVDDASLPFWRRYSRHGPSDIETAAYALLTHTTLGDTASGLEIMRWLMSQRNSLGGFRSTQDTVIGLQALAEYAELTRPANFDINVVVSAGAFRHRFQRITAENSTVLNAVVLPQREDMISLDVTGAGIALVQIAWQYNLKPEAEISNFELTVDTIVIDNNTVDVKSCIKWMKPEPSGMVVMEFGLLSGFVVDSNKVETPMTAKRTEVNDGNVVVYYDQVDNAENQCTTVRSNRDQQVANPQAAEVKYYSYYQPKEQIIANYQAGPMGSVDPCTMCQGECPICTAVDNIKNPPTAGSATNNANLLMIILGVTAWKLF